MQLTYYVRYCIDNKTRKALKILSRQLSSWIGFSALFCRIFDFGFIPVVSNGEFKFQRSAVPFQQLGFCFSGDSFRKKAGSAAIAKFK
jgi:hypothetical protein